MDEVIERPSLPKIRNNRANTEGNKYSSVVNYRNSFNLQDKTSLYLKSYNNHLKDKRKMVSLFYKNLFPNKLYHPDAIQVKVSRKQTKQKQPTSQTIQFKTSKKTDTQQQKSLTGSQDKFTFNKLLLSDVQNFYLKEIKPRKFDQKTLSLFIQMLQDNNSIVKRISPIILQSLLKLGFVTRYEQGDLIYCQGSPIKNIGLILWGQTILKKQNSKFKFNCYAGYGLGEQILFQKISHIQARSSNIEKGRFLTYEKCKSVGSCGVLFIGDKQYNWISEELTIQGLKQVVTKFERLLLRSYLKKREKRLFFG